MDGAQPRHRSSHALEVACIVAGCQALSGSIRGPFFLQQSARLNCEVWCQASLTTATCLLSTSGLFLQSLVQRWLGLQKSLWLFFLGSFLCNLASLWQPHSLGLLTLPALVSQSCSLLQALALDLEAQVPGSQDRAPAQLVGVAARLGGVLGPLLSVLVASSFSGACFTALLLDLLTLPALLMLPEVPPSAQRLEGEVLEAANAVLTAARRPEAAFLLCLRFFLGFGFHLFNTLFAVTLISHHDAEPALVATLASTLGVLSLLTSRSSSTERWLRLSPAAGFQTAMYMIVALVASRLTAFLCGNFWVVLVSFAALHLAIGPLEADLLSLMSSVELTKNSFPTLSPGLLDVIGILSGVAGSYWAAVCVHVGGPYLAITSLLVMYMALLPFIAIGFPRLVAPAFDTPTKKD